MQEEKDKKSLLDKNKSSVNAYVKYSGMGIQMALIILGLSFLGVKLDDYLKTKPVFTVILSLAAVILAMYVFIRQVSNESDNKKSEK
jgi:F0F1-type ATP synthase assembly protein I